MRLRNQRKMVYLLIVKRIAADKRNDREFLQFAQN